VVDPELRFSFAPGGSNGASDEDRFCTSPLGDRLCYRTHGAPGGEPVLLIAGLGIDQTSWPAALIAALVDHGYHVITLDNRDVGRSARASTPPPGVARQLLGMPRADGYDLGDMAADAVAVLAHLGIDAAHLVGMSMGGMIAQEIATRTPERALTLTSIFSTTGARDVGQPAASTLALLARPSAPTRADAVAGYVAILRHIGGPGVDEAAVRAYAERAWDRGDGRTARAGRDRQINAILRSGDRTRRLRRVVAPTLVIHGARDRLVAPSGGQATAAAIPGARLVTIPDMEHYLAAGVIPRLVELITAHVDEHGRPPLSSSQGVVHG
jgi:pimeloyl-ACP methyl ester carboxylesterase